MNTLGLMQSKRGGLQASLTLQETRSIHDSMNIPKWNSFLNTMQAYIVKIKTKFSACSYDLAVNGHGRLYLKHVYCLEQ